MGDKDQPTRQAYDGAHNWIRLFVNWVNPAMGRKPNPAPWKKKAPAVLMRGAKNKEGERSEKVGKPSRGVGIWGWYILSEGDDS